MVIESCTSKSPGSAARATATGGASSSPSNDPQWRVRGRMRTYGAQPACLWKTQKPKSNGDKRQTGKGSTPLNTTTTPKHYYALPRQKKTCADNRPNEDRRGLEWRERPPADATLPPATGENEYRHKTIRADDGSTWKTTVEALWEAIARPSHSLKPPRSMNPTTASGS